MQHLRLSLIVILSVLSALASANWSALSINSSGSRSITTFNGDIYVATWNTGVRKSTDDGATWSLVNNGLPVTNGFVNAQSVGHSASALFCGTESGIFRSTNGGASWESVNSTLPATTSIYANKFYSFNNVTFAVFTGTVAQNAGGVFRTTDNGNTWLQAFSGLATNMTVYNLDQDGNTLYASTSTALMKSLDLGQSWVIAHPTANFPVFAVQVVAGRIMATTSFGFRYSTNGGATWVNSLDYPVNIPQAGSELIAYDNKLFAITKSGNLGCYRSTNGGVNWTAFNTGLGDADVFSQEEFHAGGNTLYIACLLDSYTTPGSTVGLDEVSDTELPTPFPTTFVERFTIDLSAMEAGGTLVLIDAAGREVVRKGGLPAGQVIVERADLGAGRYECVLFDRSGARYSLGPVIAQ